MTTSASAVRSRQGWLWSLGVLLALACGNVRSAAHTSPNAEDGGEANIDTPAATSGTSPDTPNHPDFGGTGAGGEPVFGEASLCIYPEDIPANWGPDMVSVDSGHECPVGVLGNFFFMDCPYELLDVTPHDVDPFTGGHSHCCYKSRGVYCR